MLDSVLVRLGGIQAEKIPARNMLGPRGELVALSSLESTTPDD